MKGTTMKSGKAMNRSMDEETKELEAEASTPGDNDTKEPGDKGKAPHQARKRGGKVHGKEAMGRPDRRARGGATSDNNPFTAAGKVSSPDYQAKSSVQNGGGKGPDSNPYSGKGHRRPG